jgi:hypothetical protein
MKITIKRTMQDEHQSLGDLTISGDAFSCKTLELPWLENQSNVSCVPEGNYVVKKRNSEKYGDHFHLQDVPNRTYILIHHGNYKRDVKGCILVGKEHLDIDSDGHNDVTSSKNTMKDLNSILPDEFELEIIKV